MNIPIWCFRGAVAVQALVALEADKRSAWATAVSMQVVLFFFFPLFLVHSFIVIWFFYIASCLHISIFVCETNYHWSTTLLVWFAFFLHEQNPHNIWPILRLHFLPARFNDRFLEKTIHLVLLHVLYFCDLRGWKDIVSWISFLSSYLDSSVTTKKMSIYSYIIKHILAINNSK